MQGAVMDNKLLSLIEDLPSKDDTEWDKFKKAIKKYGTTEEKQFELDKLKKLYKERRKRQDPITFPNRRSPQE